MRAALALALARERRRCEHDTTYELDQLGAWLRDALPPGWRVLFPSRLGDRALAVTITPSHIVGRAGAAFSWRTTQ